MMYACASDTPFEEASSAHGSAQKPAWRVGDTADVMFNIDNSPERNGLWSFRKILCISFFFLFLFLTTISWPCAWIHAIHQLDLMGEERYPQSSYHLRWKMNSVCENMAEQSGDSRVTLGALQWHATQKPCIVSDIFVPEVDVFISPCFFVEKTMLWAMRLYLI